MGYGAVLRERFPIIRFLVNAQKTVWYPILFAVLCIISGSSGREIYMPIIYILCSFVLFSIIFTDDNIVFLTPMLMIYYSIGMDNPGAIPGGTTEDSLLSSFDMRGFYQIIFCGVIVVSAFIARLIADGSIAVALKQRRWGAIGILALDVAFITNGFFNPNYTPMNLLYGFIIAVAITLFYFASSGMLQNSKNFIPYACKVMVCTAYLTLFQAMIRMQKAYYWGTLFMPNSADGVLKINRGAVTLAWGLATMIAAVFVLGIPAAMYLARNCKYSVISYASAFVFLAGAFVINTRSAMLVGGVALVVCAIMCCCKSKERPANAIYCRILFLTVAIAAGYYIIKLLSKPDILGSIMTSLRLDNLDDGARIDMWLGGWRDFVANPIFGSGFDTGSNITNNVFSSMYHCILVQFLGSTGIVGIVAFVIHAVSLIIVFFKKPSIDKTLLLMIPLMVLGMSLVDNFFFYPNFQIFYSVFIVMAEYCGEGSSKTASLKASDSSSLPDIT